MISIVDCGFGNIASVRNAFAKIGEQTSIAKTPKEIESAEKLVLPGVGNFGSAMQMIRRNALEQSLKGFVASGKPFLGICIGLQLLFEQSEESPCEKGLGVLQGNVVRFCKAEKLPQIGWNKVQAKKGTLLFEGIAKSEWFYFVNSFFAKPSDTAIVSGNAFYGERFCAAIERGNIFATQFHPEKSGVAGLKLLKNFAGVIK